MPYQCQNECHNVFQELYILFKYNSCFSPCWKSRWATGYQGDSANFGNVIYAGYFKLDPDYKNPDSSTRYGVHAHNTHSARLEETKTLL